MALTERVLSPLFTWRSVVMESPVSSRATYVALVLSMHMSERGDSCFPSLETLAAESKMSRPTILKGIVELERSGLLKVVRLKKPGRGMKNRYVTTLPKGIEDLPFYAKRVKSMSEKGIGALLEDVKEDVKERGGAKARKEQEQRSNVVPADPYRAVAQMIRNGVLTDAVEVHAEADGYRLSDAQLQDLVALLEEVAA